MFHFHALLLPSASERYGWPEVSMAVEKLSLWQKNEEQDAEQKRRVEVTSQSGDCHLHFACGFCHVHACVHTNTSLDGF